MPWPRHPHRIAGRLSPAQRRRCRASCRYGCSRLTWKLESKLLRLYHLVYWVCSPISPIYSTKIRCHWTKCGSSFCVWATRWETSMWTFSPIQSRWGVHFDRWAQAKCCRAWCLCECNQVCGVLAKRSLIRFLFGKLPWLTMETFGRWPHLWGLTQACSKQWIGSRAHALTQSFRGHWSLRPNLKFVENQFFITFSLI